MIQQFQEYLGDNWPALFPGAERPERFSFLQAQGFRKPLLFVFVNKDSWPRLVIKISDQPGIAACLRKESENLAKIKQANLNTELGAFPRSLFLDAINGYTVLMQSVIPGRAMSGFVGQGEERQIHLAGQWLSRFHCATKAWGEQTDLSVGLQNSIEGFRAGRDFSQKEGQFLKRMAQNAANFKPENLPAVFRHYDFSPANIILSNSGLAGVIDWEYAQFPDLPLIDLFNFLVRYHNRALIGRKQTKLDSDWTRSKKVGKTSQTIAAFRQTLFTASAYARLAKQAIAEYCASLKIDPGLVKVLLLKYLIDDCDISWFRLLVEKEQDLILN
ncbi:phosphotransferase family protein [Candidatus Omnitrophota bacterium]